MFKDRDDKWTRPRGFWELNGGDLLMLLTALFFLALAVGGFGMVLVQPRIHGLHELFSDPPPTPPANQKLHLAPGETEMKLYAIPAKKPAESQK